MSRQAVEAIDEALQDTKQLLLPLDAGTWARLAILVVFTAGFGGAPTFPSDTGDTGGFDSGSDFGPDAVQTPSGAFSAAALLRS